MITITKQECRDIKHTLRSMLRAMTTWTPTAKEGMMTSEEIQALQDDAQSIINTLETVESR